MALDATKLGIFFSMGEGDQIYSFRNSCDFLQGLSKNAEWPEESRDKINEYIKAFDTIKRYGLEDEGPKPSEEEVNKAAAIIDDSQKILSSKADNDRTVYQCMMDQYRKILKKQRPNESDQKLETRFQRYSQQAENNLQNTFNLLGVNCDLQRAKQLNPQIAIPIEQDQKAEIPPEPVLEANDPAPAEPLFVPKPTVRKTAAKWIEDTRRPETLYKEVNGRKVVDYDHVVRIMAARHYAQSVRKSGEKLVSTTIKEKDLDKQAKHLKTLPHFNDFIESLKDPAKQKKMLNAIGKGHCGGLDDMFKDYLRNLPAGQLENTPELKRYMPTAKERIEALKKQTGQLGRIPTDPIEKKEYLKKKATAAAEIVQLRNLVQAERKKKSTLDVKIPVDPENSLQTGTNKLVNDNEAYKALCSDDTQQLLQEGHGGEMTILLRDKMRMCQQTGNKMGDDACRILKHNTYEGRMEELREEAGRIPGLLDSQDEISALKTIDRSKEMLGQYFSYNSDFIGKDGWIPNMDEMLHKDIPWSKMNNRFQTVKNFEPYKVFANDIDIENIEYTKDLMGEMAEMGQKPFFNKRIGEYGNYKKNEQDELEKQKALEEFMKKNTKTKHKIDYDEEFEQGIGGEGIGL